jgi:hypothetical protein
MLLKKRHAKFSCQLIINVRKGFQKGNKLMAPELRISYVVVPDGDGDLLS